MLGVQFHGWTYGALLLLVPALIALYGYGLWRRRRTLAAFIDPSLASRLVQSVDPRARGWKSVCIIVAVALLVVALMQPQWGEEEDDVPRRGRDLIVLLDLSLSMLAEDATPNRIERAKQAVREFVDALAPEGGHRLGLVTFAGRASLQSPLTLDYKLFLERLNEARVGGITRDGTVIGDALKRTLQSYGELASGYTDILMITDGEDHESLPMEAALMAAAQEIAVHAIGIGDPEEGARIPVDDGKGNITYVTFEGSEVSSRMQAELLTRIAETTGGVYLAAGNGPLQLDQLYREHIQDKPRREVDAASSEDIAEQYHWFLMLALILLVVEMLIPETRRRPERRALSDPT